MRGPVRSIEDFNYPVLRPVFNCLITDHQICEMLSSNTLTRVWMDDLKAPVAYGQRNGHTEWLSYDDVQSMEEKVRII